MISSKIDDAEGKKEFEMIYWDQDHMNKVWSMMQPKLEEYVDGYLEGISHYNDENSKGMSPEDRYTVFLNKMIRSPKVPLRRYFW